MLYYKKCAWKYTLSFYLLLLHWTIPWNQFVSYLQHGSRETLPPCPLLPQHVKAHLPICKFSIIYPFYCLLFQWIFTTNHYIGPIHISLKMWRWRKKPWWTWGSSFKSRLRDPSSERSRLKSRSCRFKGGPSSRCLCCPEARSSQFQERWKWKCGQDTKAFGHFWRN